MSGEEERWLGLGRLGSALVAVLVAVLFIVLLAGSMPMWLTLLLSAAAAGLAAIGAWTVFKKRAVERAKPEKLAVLNCVRMDSFSWRATTFEFENVDFAGRFADLNRSRLMEATG